jgi:hypothetical protein
MLLKKMEFLEHSYRLGIMHVHAHGVNDDKSENREFPGPKYNEFLIYIICVCLSVVVKGNILTLSLPPTPHPPSS